jgi:hypothetical protein
MSCTGKVVIGVGTLVLLLGGTILPVLVRNPPRPRAPAASGSTATLAIELFRTVVPAPQSWTAPVFAESLAARLRRMPGLEIQIADAGAGHTSEFILRGDATLREGRLVIATRLFQQEKRSPVWTATYWASDTASTSLVQEVASGVAEALYGQLARRSPLPAS